MVLGIGIGTGYAKGRPFIPTDYPGCEFWCDADMGITLNGGTVAAWADQNPNARHAAQGVAANQPTMAAGGPGGRTSVLWDTTTDHLILGGPPFGPETSHTIVAGLDIQAVPNPWGDGGAIVNCELGTGFSAHVTDTNAVQHGMLTGGGWQVSGAAPVVGAQTIIHIADGVAPLGSVYRDGAPIGNHVYVPRAMTTVAIGNGGIPNWLQSLNAHLWKLAIYSRVVTAPEIALLHAWAAS